MAQQTLNVPPFPSLEVEGHFAIGQVKLASWAGFQSRGGAYGAVDSAAKSEGDFKLMIDGVSPSAEQIRAFQFLLDNERAVARSVLDAIFSSYPEEREKYGFDDDEEAELMPEIQNSDQLRSLIGLSIVHMLGVSKDGIAYIGFEFGCTWDDEHGVGVMTHRDRVVEVGGADTSFLEWIAEKDSESGNGR